MSLKAAPLPAATYSVRWTDDALTGHWIITTYLHRNVPERRVGLPADKVARSIAEVESVISVSSTSLRAPMALPVSASPQESTVFVRLGSSSGPPYSASEALRMDCEIGLGTPGLPPPSEEAIHCQRARTAQDQRREAGKIEEVTFISRRSKLRVSSSHAKELDRTETVGQMHSKNRHQQEHGQRQTDDGHEGAQKYC